MCQMVCSRQFVYGAIMIRFYKQFSRKSVKRNGWSEASTATVTMMLAQYFDDVVVVGVAAVAVAVSVADALLRSGRFCCVLFSSAQLRSGIAGSGLVWSVLLSLVFHIYYFISWFIAMATHTHMFRSYLCTHHITDDAAVLRLLQFLFGFDAFFLPMAISIACNAGSALGIRLSWRSQLFSSGLVGSARASVLLSLWMQKKTHTIQPNKLYCRVLCSTIDNALNTEKM